MSNNLYIDFHVLQTVPPSCVNRDDTGSPKTAVFGGKTRARVSSQAWKRAIRTYFKELLSSEQIGFRTKKIKALICEKVMELDPNCGEEQAESLVSKAMESLKFKTDADKKDVLFFISSLQVESFAKTVLELRDNNIKNKDKEKKLRESLKENPSFDIVLFGRMAANDPSLNYDAAAQVAHSISTHAVSNEYDYFTAVDDCAEEDNSGAGHLGVVEYNSSTMYRYATVNVNELAEHLDVDETITAVLGFTEAFVKSMPTGKQSTFANRTLPDMVYVTIRRDQPVNLVNAYEKPVLSHEGGYIESSKGAFIRYTKELYSMWVSSPEVAWVVGSSCDDLAEGITFPELLNSVRVKLEDILRS